MELENIIQGDDAHRGNRRHPAVCRDTARPARLFKTVFCRRFNCPASEYENLMFRKLLYPHARPIALMIRKLNPAFFSEDIKFIRYLGEAEDYREAAASIADFRDANMSRANPLRRGFRIRLSGRTAGRLVRRIFFDSGQGIVPAD